MTIAKHLVKANWAGFADGAKLNADIVIHDNLVAGVAAATGLTPPTGYVHGYIKARIENGVMLDVSGAEGVLLTSADPQLNITGTLQYTFEHHNVTIDGVAVPGSPIPSVTYSAPADATPENLLDHVGDALFAANPAITIGTSQVTGLTAFVNALIAAGGGGTGGQASLTPTAVKTAAYTAAVSDLVPVDATSAAVTITLPTAPADKSRIAVKKIDASTNAVSVTLGGSDVLNKTGGSTSLSLTVQNQGVVLQYKASGAIWYVVSTDVPLSAIDARIAAAIAGVTTDEYHEYASLAAFPATGAADRIYVALDTGRFYRWTGSAYVQTASPATTDALAEGSTNKYYTDARAQAANASAIGANTTAIATKATDLVDTAVSAPGVLVAGQNSGVTAAGTYTAPTPAGAVTTPPQRFAITNRTTSAVTLSMPNPAGTVLSLTVLAGEVITFRQVSTSGYVNESGNKPLSQLDARYVQPAVVRGVRRELAARRTVRISTVQPTITLSAADAATTISGSTTRTPKVLSGTTVDMVNDPQFTYLGTPSLSYGTSANAAVVNPPLLTGSNGGRRWVPSYGFNFYGDKLEVLFKPTGGLLEYRLRVDGDLVSENCNRTTGLTTTSVYRLLIDFGSVGHRLVHLDWNTPFNGIACAPAHSISRSSDLYEPPTIVLGDSTTAGANTSSGAAGYGPIDSWLGTAAYLLGWRNVHNVAIAGTGFTNAGSDAAFTSRTVDFAVSGARRIIVHGGYNDTATYNTTLSAAVDSVFSAIVAAAPQEFIVIGCHPKAGDIYSNSTYLAINALLSSKAAQYGATFIDPFVLQPITTANASVFVNADAIHNTRAGAQWTGRVYADAQANSIPALIA